MLHLLHGKHKKRFVWSIDRTILTSATPPQPNDQYDHIWSKMPQNGQKWPYICAISCDATFFSHYLFRVEFATARFKKKLKCVEVGASTFWFNTAAFYQAWPGSCIANCGEIFQACAADQDETRKLDTKMNIKSDPEVVQRWHTHH